MENRRKTPRGKKRKDNWGIGKNIKRRGYTARHQEQTQSVARVSRCSQSYHAGNLNPTFQLAQRKIVLRVPLQVRPGATIVMRMWDDFLRSWDVVGVRLRGRRIHRTKTIGLYRVCALNRVHSAHAHGHGVAGHLLELLDVVAESGDLAFE